MTSLFTTMVTAVGQLGRSWRIRSGRDGAELSLISCVEMTFVRRVVELAVTDCSPEAVPELAQAPAAITRPNANAAIRMTISCGAGSRRAPRLE
jgi:hypothetical protein